MKIKCYSVIFILAVFFLLQFYPTSTFAETQKVKVVVENASVRANADMQSEVVLKPSVGDVFEVEGKENEWYKIQFRSAADVIITGYIHEMFVVPTEAATAKATPAKKTPPPPKPQPSVGKASRGEIVFRVGYNLSYASADASSYAGSFSGGVLTNVNAAGRITAELDTPLAFDGAINYYFAKGLGVQVRFDVNSKAKFGGNSVSDYQLSWAWQSGESYSAQDAWPVNGDLSMSVISGNIIYKIQGTSMIVPLLSAGVSYFTGKINGNTRVGYAYTWEIDPYQFIDYFDIPATIDKNISGIGFNIGGGLDWTFSRSIALNVDARFFVKGATEAPWMLQAGTYTSNIQEGWTLTLTQAEVEQLEQAISPLNVKLSFFKIALGLKILF
jgi:hypothetical protein